MRTSPKSDGASLSKLREQDAKRLSEILEAEQQRLMRSVVKVRCFSFWPGDWICFGVFKIFGPVALLIFIAITIGALVVTTIRAWHKWQGRQ